MPALSDRPGRDGGRNSIGVGCAKRLINSTGAPIPGTKRVSRVEKNTAADHLELSAGQIERLNNLTPGRSEWRLIAATHNLLKLHRHRLRTAGV
jgi:hypothetical protein